MRDTIKVIDVGRASDVIELSRQVFRELELGRLEASEFEAIRPGATVDENDRILYNRDSGLLFYDADGRGGAAAKAFTLIENPAALQFSDFLVVA